MRWIAALWVVGCSGPDPVPSDLTPDDGVGLIGDSIANPFPNAMLLGADGHLDLDAASLPSGGSTLLPVQTLAWRTGFSVAQPSVLRLEGIDAADLPGPEPAVPNLGSVRMVDLTEGQPIPCMAELDAFPNALERALIVRPLQAVPAGHQVGVLLTTSAVARPARFDALLSDAPPASLASVAQHHRDLVADLAAATGLPQGEIAVAWDYPVGDGTAPLTSALDQLTVPGGVRFTRVRELDADDDVAPMTWRVAEGTFDVVDYLVDDLSLDLQSDGTVAPVGSAEAELYVHIPTSVADAPAGTVPVLVFGHGIFSQPSNYLDDADDPSGVLQLAEEGGYIVVATTWRGLTWNDRAHPVALAGDFGKFPELTSRLVQGQVNTRTLIELAASGALFDDPVFVGTNGQSLPDSDHVRYYGISLGAIEGAVMWAHDPPMDAAAFHVGGSMWSTMLERSSNWTAFELLLPSVVPEPADRQILYAVSQLWWDPVDPISWVDALRTRPFLMQQALGDEQVANLTTDALARSVGIPLLAPPVQQVDGLTTQSAPMAPGSSALVQFDPQLAYPPDENRPAPVTGAHDGPRTWSGARQQVVDYLRVGEEGTVTHHCGAGPCTATNPGP